MIAIEEIRRGRVGLVLASCISLYHKSLPCIYHFLITTLSLPSSHFHSTATILSLSLPSTLQARHVVTGEPIPDLLLARLMAAKSFNQVSGSESGRGSDSDSIRGSVIVRESGSGRESGAESACSQ